jgi:hypothetical protein
MSSYLDIINRPHIYIDYESNKAGNIYLLGYQRQNNFQQKIMDNRLQGLASFHRLEIIDPIQGTYDLLNIALETNAIIVAYSEAERKIFHQIQGHSRTDIFKEVPYLNLLKAAKKWIKDHHSAKFEALPPFKKTASAFQSRRLKRALCSVMRLTSFQAPTDYAPGKTTKRFDTVAKALVLRGHDYSRLTAVQKQNATKGLKHNKFDVEALPVLFNSIYSEDPACFANAIKNCFD